MLEPPNLGLVLAKRGGGKSTLVNTILKESDRFIVYDFVHEYDYRELRAVTVFYFADLQRLIQQGEPRLIFRPMKRSKAAFEYFCAMLWSIARDYVVVIEEANNENAMGVGGEWSKTIVDMGRHNNLGMLAVSRRPYGLSMLFISQVDVFWIGGPDWIPVDNNFFRQFLDADVFEKIKTLQKFVFLRVVPDPSRMKVPLPKIGVVTNKEPFNVESRTQFKILPSENQNSV